MTLPPIYSGRHGPCRSWRHLDARATKLNPLQERSHHDAIGRFKRAQTTGSEKIWSVQGLIISPALADTMCFGSGYGNCEPGRGCVPRTIAPRPPAGALPRVRVMFIITVTRRKVWPRPGCSQLPLGKPWSRFEEAQAGQAAVQASAVSIQ